MMPREREAVPCPWRPLTAQRVADGLLKAQEAENRGAPEEGEGARPPRTPRGAATSSRGAETTGGAEREGCSAGVGAARTKRCVRLQRP